MAQSEEQTHGPPLSKGELLALYQAAVAKGSGLNLSALPQLPLTSEYHQQQGKSGHEYFAMFVLSTAPPGSIENLIEIGKALNSR